MGEDGDSCWQKLWNGSMQQLLLVIPQKSSEFSRRRANKMAESVIRAQEHGAVAERVGPLEAASSQVFAQRGQSWRFLQSPLRPLPSIRCGPSWAAPTEGRL